jgi:hypothetical protein
MKYHERYSYRTDISVAVPAGKHDLKNRLGGAKRLLQSAATLQMREKFDFFHYISF